MSSADDADARAGGFPFLLLAILALALAMVLVGLLIGLTPNGGTDNAV